MDRVALFKTFLGKQYKGDGGDCQCNGEAVCGRNIKMKNASKTCSLEYEVATSHTNVVCFAVLVGRVDSS